MASRSSLALITLTVVALLPLGAQQRDTTRFHLDIPSIMRGEETVGRSPTGVQWSADSKWIYFQWAPPGTDWRAPTMPYRVRAEAGAVPEKVSAALRDSVLALNAGGPTTRDGKWRVVNLQGDLWLVDMSNGQRRRLTNTAQAEQAVGWSFDNSRIFYRVADAVFSLRVADGYIEQLADIRAASATTADVAIAGRGGAATGGAGGRGRGSAAGAADTTSPQRQALARDQRELFQVLRDRAYADSLNGGGRGGRGAGGGGRGGFAGGGGGATGALRPVTLAADEALRALWVSPSGKQMIFTVSTNAATSPTVVPTWVTSTGYVTEQQGRAKVGDAVGRQRLGVLDFATSRVNWISGVAPVFGDSAGHFARLTSLGWNDDGTAALILAEPSNYKSRVILRLDADSNRLVTVEALRDSAWIGGPCEGCGGWLPGDRGMWWVSEADGYAHVYTARADGSGKQQLTKGKWEVLAATLSQDRTRFEMRTSEPSPYEEHFYTMGLDGSARTRMTARPGGHQVTISPDGTMYADIFSYSNEPPELYLQPAKPMAATIRLTTSPTMAWRAFKWLDPEIVEIPGSDGVKVPARIYRPEQLGAKSNGAAVLFIHGAGYLHNVTRTWSSYFREYQFNHLLASKGYIVLDLDYRGSAGYGRDWRTAIYRHMGGRDLEDYVDASRWITAKYGIGPKHIGTYGGSYGGFLTLMALFTRSQYFGAGAALRAVSDWAHYNHGYTAQILNQPQDDSVAYHQSSPIFFAEGLQAPLLLAHGMVDSNVEFEDAVRLTQRLIELGKTNWWLAPYPVEDHGFTRPDSWTDEYRRILELFDQWLPRGVGNRNAGK